MNVKTLITGLALLLLLSSGTANAGWGDVYYCQMTNYGEIKLDGEKKSYRLEKFQFKLDQKRKSMVYGSGGFYNNSVSKLKEGTSWPDLESWYAYTKYSSTFFEEGKFLDAIVGVSGLAFVSANCDKF